jgi:hypothetical protein
MKKLFILFILVCATAFAQETNTLADLKLPRDVENKLKEFASSGGAVIYIVGTNSVQINYLPAETNKIINSSYINTNSIYPAWNRDFSTNEFSIDLHKVQNYMTTWVYKDFQGRVGVSFDVEGWGFSPSYKKLLEEEIGNEIQRILDLHFPKENK